MKHISNSQLVLFTTGLLIAMVMSVFVWYSNSNFHFSVFGYELKKNKDLLIKKSQKKKTIKVKPKIALTGAEKKIKTVDSSHKKILLIGDSQVEGLMYPFYDYCKFNGDTLKQVVIWYSSSDKTYASNDTLKSIIAKTQPNFIVMTMGLNQLFQKEFDESEAAISKIISTFDTIPYVWIGPANWVPDNGINECYKNNIDSSHLFLSKDLQLERAGDGRHPSRRACFVWMDSIASWIQQKSAYRLKMSKPDTVYQKRYFSVQTFNVAN